MTVQSDTAAHWQNVYQTKSDHETSWFQEEPATSLKLINEFGPRGGRVIDIGGGASALAGHLAAAGYDVAVVDISAAAIERAKTRNRESADRIDWIVGDVTAIDSLGEFDLWHDRAVFHFLTDAGDRSRYLALAEKSVKPGGHLVIGTFALSGPEKCSGLAVERYDKTRLAAMFSPGFEVVRSVNEAHITPWGKPQDFCFVVMRRLNAGKQGARR